MSIYSNLAQASGKGLVGREDRGARICGGLHGDKGREAGNSLAQAARWLRGGGVDQIVAEENLGALGIEGGEDWD